MINTTSLDHETAVRVFQAHQEGETVKRVSRSELQVLRFGDDLIGKVQTLIPKAGNLALFTISEPELTLNSEKMVDVMRLLVERYPALNENDLTRAACFREVSRQLGSAQCTGFAWTTFYEAVLALPPGATISILGSREADHVFVQIEFAGCRPVIVDPWIPGSKAVLLEDHFLNNPRAPAAEFRAEAVSQGLAGTTGLVQWKEPVKDLDLTKIVADALAETASLSNGEVLKVQEGSQRLNSTVTNTGSPMRYEAR
jgi:hypothetical protein